jgi:polyisoprenoid-binding protein YceI
MRRKTMATALILVLSIAISASGADKFALDQAHSSIGFSVRHLVISKTKGSFHDAVANVMYDKKDITKSSVDVTIKVASIDTDNEDRDNHLKSPDFFDVEKFPEMTFKSKSIKKSKDGFVAVGDLTIRDVTKEIELPFKILGIVDDPWGNTKMGVEAGITIDRRDYGLTWSKVVETGALVVGNEVEILLSLEFGKEK